MVTAFCDGIYFNFTSVCRYASLLLHLNSWLSSSITSLLSPLLVIFPAPHTGSTTAGLRQWRLQPLPLPSWVWIWGPLRSGRALEGVGQIEGLLAPFPSAEGSSLPRPLLAFPLFPNMNLSSFVPHCRLNTVPPKFICWSLIPFNSECDLIESSTVAEVISQDVVLLVRGGS